MDAIEYVQFSENDNINMHYFSALLLRVLVQYYSMLGVFYVIELFENSV